MIVRVAHIITTLDLGGAQATVLETVTGLDPCKFRPTVVTGDDPATGDLESALAEAGIDVIKIGSLHRSIGWTEVMACNEIRRVLNDLRPQIVHTHSSKAGVLGRIAARLSNARPAVVHTVHGWSFHDRQRTLFRGLAVGVERLLARITDRLVVVTETDADIGALRRIGRPDKYRLIRSGVSFPPRQDADSARLIARSRLGLEADAQVLGWVGRFSKQKDVDTLASTVIRLAGELPSLTSILIGDGPDRSSVQSRIDASGASDHIVLEGLRDDAADLYPAFDVVLLTSAWEGLPRTVVEALASGVPVVATDVGGVWEVVRDHQNGVLAARGDVQALASGVVSCLSGKVVGPDLKEQEELRKGFSAERMVQETASLYAELMVGDT